MMIICEISVGLMQLDGWKGRVLAAGLKNFELLLNPGDVQN